VNIHATRHTPALAVAAQETKPMSIFGKPKPTETFPVQKTDAEWRHLLTAEQYDVLRGHGTERAGSCALNHEKRAGTFSCAGCGLQL